MYGELLAVGGKVVVYGSSQGTIGMPFRPLIMNFISVYFFIVYRLTTALLEQTSAGITQLLRQSALRHSETRIFPLGQIAAAHELVERGAEAKVLVQL
jgi:NADPH:quinone reductase